MTDRDEVPTSPTGKPLFDLGSGVYAEWWRVVDPDHPDYPNDPGRVYGVVEHHWCVSDVEIIPGVTEYWARGSVPTMTSQPVKWTIEAGEPEKFEGLTLSPSILCKRCGLHGWIRDGRWVPA